MSGQTGMTQAELGATRPEQRSLGLFGAALAAALALFFCVGHASHASMGMGEPDALVHGVGVCLLAAILLVAPVLPALPAYRVKLQTSSPALSFAPIAAAVQAAPARASPAWLQRFRN